MKVVAVPGASCLRSARWCGPLLAVALIIGCSGEDRSTPQPESGGPPSADPALLDQAVDGAPLPARACSQARCRVVLDTIARITDTDGLIPELAFFEKDSEGRIWVTNFQRNGLIRIDPSGGDTVFLGGPGAGPGEFDRIGTPLMGPGDSLHVYDMGTERLTVFTPDLTVARTLRIPAPPSVRLPDGKLVIAAPIHTRESIGYPMHLAAADGTVEASFGVDEPRHAPGEQFLQARAAGPGAEGTFWIAAPAESEYALERWDPYTQERVARWVHDPVWFEGAGFPMGDPRRAPIRPHIARIWEDEHGVLWTLVSVPAIDWAPIENITTPWIEAEEYAAVMDWILVAHDPGTGELVAELRIERRVSSWPPHALLVHGVEHLGVDTLAWHLSVPRLEPER